jgi:phenylpropionate dioxygenase-like ring-hydroxylating dioxygenase large terminal subunit
VTDSVANAWMVAARSDELTDKPLARRLLDVSVVLFRGIDGTAAALKDRCPHLEAPLSTGSIAGDLLICAYHGMRVNRDGACVDARLTDEARAVARVRTFSVVERDGTLWIWMGDSVLADPALIESFATSPKTKV